MAKKPKDELVPIHEQETLSPTDYPGVEIYDPEKQQNSFRPEDLYSDLNLLLGAKVEYIGTIPAEMVRSVSQYVLMRLRMPNRKTLRVILLADVVARPCPADLEMWEHMNFFDIGEIKARRMGHVLILPEYEEEQG